MEEVNLEKVHGNYIKATLKKNQYRKLSENSISYTPNQIPANNYFGQTISNDQTAAKKQEKPLLMNLRGYPVNDPHKPHNEYYSNLNMNLYNKKPDYGKTFNNNQDSNKKINQNKNIFNANNLHSNINYSHTCDNDKNNY